MAGMKITDIRAYPVSVRVENGATLAIGRAVKRDAVIVKVTAEDGLVGFGESHHARSANVTAEIVNTTLKDIVLPASADDVVGIWGKIYDWQLKSHGMGAATAMAMSGLDMALWDIRAKAVGWPLWKLLGGSVEHKVKAYAGGVALGWQEPAALVDEVAPHVAKGYKAVKLRVGDTVERDVARVAAVRKTYGDGLIILVDANTGYSIDQVRKVMPAYEELGVDWLEEPFAPNDHSNYERAARLGRVPLAAGENHYTRFEFARVIDDGVISVLQPDLSKAGGVTEVMRIAHAASMWRLPICPHSSITALNMAATIHLLKSIDNAGYFEADVSVGNPFREELSAKPYTIMPDGTVELPDGPGIGIDVNEHFLAAHSYIGGRNFV
jgi:L-alanine-DL-glutamate epimerase-like enolase superfamily enzyme